jgi:hypothetical protein
LGSGPRIAAGTARAGWVPMNAKLLGPSVVAFGALLAACADVEAPVDGDGLCEPGKCDGLPFLKQLEGRQDPIALYLRQLGEAGVIDAQGVYHASKGNTVEPKNDPLFYSKVLTGISKVQGCDVNSLINYALSDDLISGDVGNVFPRLISTLCSTDAEKSTNAFVATLGVPTEDGDLGLDDLEMFAWDPVAAKYSFYATSPDGDGNLQLEVNPARCKECHETPRDVDSVGMPRLPIMNELTKAWTHWNAGASAVSESFLVPSSLDNKPNWTKYGIQKVGAASRLEKVIRDANALKVAPARAKQLFRPAKIDEAMGLIRPIFCDEQVNYISELQTGEISIDAVVAGGIKSAYRGIQSTWNFPWFNNDIMKLTIAPGDPQVFMVPVRGVADLTFEQQLQGVLSPMHILAVRALDWKRPALSEFRCNLWRTAREAFKTKPPALTGRNRDAVKVLYEEIMKLGGMSTRGIPNGKFVVMDLASEATVKKLKEQIAGGSVSTTCREGAANICETDATGFGALLQAYIDFGESAPRAQLLEERDRRVCNVVNGVLPAETQKDFGPGIRIPNHPSFFNLKAGATSGNNTVPAGCDTNPPRPELAKNF